MHKLSLIVLIRHCHALNTLTPLTHQTFAAIHSKKLEQPRKPVFVVSWLPVYLKVLAWIPPWVYDFSTPVVSTSMLVSAKVELLLFPLVFVIRKFYSFKFIDNWYIWFTVSMLLFTMTLWISSFCFYNLLKDTITQYFEKISEEAFNRNFFIVFFLQWQKKKKQSKKTKTITVFLK